MPLTLDPEYQGRKLRVPVGTVATGETKAYRLVEVMSTIELRVAGEPILMFIHRNITRPELLVLAHWESGKAAIPGAVSLADLLQKADKLFQFNIDERSQLLTYLRCAAFDDHINDLPRKDDQL